MPRRRLVLGIPSGRQVGHVQIVVQQVLFEFKANQNVQVVGRFVRFHAHQRRPHVVHGEIELIQRNILQSLGIDLLSRWEEVRPEGSAAADQVFPQPRLRLVDAQRNGFAQRQSVLLGPQPLFVNAMPRFVQDAEEAGVKKPLLVTRGDAAVVRAHGAAEWVRRDVEPAAVETEANARRHVAAEGFLSFDRIAASEQRNVGLPAAGANRSHQWHQRLPQTGQDF